MKSGRNAKNDKGHRYKTDGFLDIIGSMTQGKSAKSVTKSKDILKVSERSVVREIKQYNYPQALTKIMEMEKEGSGKMSDELRKKTVDALDLQATRRLYEMRCSSKRYQVITGMKYDNEGILIDSIISLKWESIKPGSIVEKLYNEVCH